MGKYASGVRNITSSYTMFGGSNRPSKLPWYTPEITDISSQAQELFEKYANVEPENVKAHIKELVCSPDNADLS